MYAALFPSKTGHPALSVRMALGSLIIQQRKNLSDRALLKAILESPYLQYFIGLTEFQKEPPYTAPALVYFRKRIDVSFLAIVNDMILANSAPTKEHENSTTHLLTRLR